MAKLISVGQIIDVAVEHYRTHGKELIGITLWLLVATLPITAADLISPIDSTEITGTGQTIAIIALQAIGAISMFIASLWTSITLTFAIRAQMEGSTVNLKELSQKAWRYLVAFAALSLCVALALTALILLLVPGILLMFAAASSEQFGGLLGALGMLLVLAGGSAAIYLLIKLSVEFAFAQYALLLESASSKLTWSGITKAIARSRALVRGRWWATLVRLAVPNIVFSLIVFGVNLALAFGASVFFAFGVGFVSPIFLQIGAALGSLLVMGVNVLSMPLYSISTYALYDSLQRDR